MRRLLLALTLVLTISTATYAETNRANSILVIAPYRSEGTWVFDDKARGLLKEPFVAGIPEMIDNLVTNIPNARKGFRLLFSAEPFPGAQTRLAWRRKDTKGNWYYSEQYKQEGWLCPSLFKYFPTAPKSIYVKAEPLKQGEE
jgi:hypothetical protein